jgi:hypothetical protein
MVAKGGTALNESGVRSKGKPFDDMNNIVANLILNLTR